MRSPEELMPPVSVERIANAARAELKAAQEARTEKDRVAYRGGAFALIALLPGGSLYEALVVEWNARPPEGSARPG